MSRIRSSRISTPVETLDKSISIVAAPSSLTPPVTFSKLLVSPIAPPLI
jgi:hypothetical protein